MKTDSTPVRPNAGDASDKFWSAVNEAMDADPKLSQQKARKLVIEKRPELAADVPDNRIARANPFEHRLMATTEQLVAGGLTRNQARGEIIRTNPDLIAAAEGSNADTRMGGAVGLRLNEGRSLDEAVRLSARDLPADAQELAFRAL